MADIAWRKGGGGFLQLTAMLNEHIYKIDLTIT